MSVLKLYFQVNYLHDFVKEDLTRYFIAGDRAHLYLYNRTVNPLTTDPAGTLTILNAVAFVGADEDRWQSCVCNDFLILVNKDVPIQVFKDSATPLAEMGIGPGAGGGTPDPDQPDGAKYVLNSVNHVIVANTIEDGDAHTQRVRWSDINPDVGSNTAPPVWTPNQITAPFNEAGFYDINDDSGEIRGLVAVGPNQFIVYTERNAYLFTYIGLPFIWNIQAKALVDIGCFGSYSLIQKEDRHFFFGQEGFYMVNSSLTPTRIGKDRVDSTLWDLMQITKPWLMHSFAHPYFPEIWFIYQTKMDSQYQHAIVYNWEKDVWCQRAKLIQNDIGFPFSAISEFLLTETRTMASVVQPASSIQTWQQKVGEGVLVLITGDKDGYLFIHDGRDIDADGVPFQRTLRSGDLTSPNYSKYLRTSRIFWDVSDIDLTKQQVVSTLLSRTSVQDTFSPLASFVLDHDSRHDVRAVDKIFQLGFDSYFMPSLSSIIAIVQPAGTRA